MSMSARDQAVEYTCRLFSIIFKRLWLPFGEREQGYIANFVDFIIEAAAEAYQPDILDELAELDPPPPPAPRRYETVKYERERVAPIPQGRR